MSVAFAKRVARQFADGGHRLLIAGRTAAARDPLRQALCVNPRLAVALRDVGVVAVRGKSLLTGISWFRRALCAAPLDAQSLDYASKCLLQLGRFRDAVDPARKQVVADPGSWIAWVQLTNVANLLPDVRALARIVRLSRHLAPPEADMARITREISARVLHQDIDAIWRSTRGHSGEVDSGLILTGGETTDEDALVRRVLAEHVTFEPFPHFLVRDLLPRDLYQEAVSLVPPTDALLEIPSSRFANRRALDVRRDGRTAFWKRLTDLLSSRALLRAMMAKLASLDLIERIEAAGFSLRPHLRMTVDNDRYALGPHRDSANRLCTGLIYLPVDSPPPRVGTSIYRPRKPIEFFDWGHHHPFERFERVAEMPFEPNACMLFLNLGEAYHGVEEIRGDTRRPIIQFTFHIEPAAPHADR